MGKRAVASHTASMGGQKEIWEALIKQVGAVQVHDFDELCNTILAFTLLPPRCYRGMTALGGGGALGVAACDEAETHGLFFPKLSGPIYETIAQDLPKPGSSGDNPIDVANPFVSPHVLGKIMREAAKDNRVDIQVPIILSIIQAARHAPGISFPAGLYSPGAVRDGLRGSERENGETGSIGAPQSPARGDRPRPGGSFAPCPARIFGTGDPRL